MTKIKSQINLNTSKINIRNHFGNLKFKLLEIICYLNYCYLEFIKPQIPNYSD